MRAIVCVLVVLAAPPLLGCPAQPQTAPPDSSVRPAEAPKAADVKLTEAVPDLPDFPNAVMASQCEKGPGDGWVRSWRRESRVTAAYQDVRKFYLEQLAKKGWTISSTKEKLDEVQWGLTKGTSWAKVELDAEHGLVEVSVERKDR